MAEDEGPAAGPGIAAARSVGVKLDFGKTWDFSDRFMPRDSSSWGLGGAWRRSGPWRIPGNPTARGDSKPGLLFQVARGARPMNVLPVPSSLSTVTSPPSSLHSSLTIDSPKPRARVFPRHGVAAGHGGPPLPELLEDQLLVLFAAIPTPVSTTRITSCSSPLAPLGADHDSLPPSGVNLMALERRLFRILLHARLVLDTPGAARAGSRRSRSMFRFSVSGRAMSHCAAMTCSMGNSVPVASPSCRSRSWPGRGCC